MPSFAQFDATHSHGVIGVVVVDNNNAPEVQSFAFFIGYDCIYIFFSSFLLFFINYSIEVAVVDNNSELEVQAFAFGNYDL